MSNNNKIVRGILVLIVMAILAVLVWRFGGGSYLIPEIGGAIIITLIVIVIFILYRSPEDTSLSNEPKRKKKAATIEETKVQTSDETVDSAAITVESENTEDEFTNSRPISGNKQLFGSKNIGKPNATDVAAKYISMAKEAEKNRISDDWQPTPKVSRPKAETSELPIDKPMAEETAEKESVPITDENQSEPPIPLIEDETTLTVDEKNQLVNAVWYRCENPFCKYTHFLGVHHITAEKTGGTNKLDNLIVLCPYCHDLAHKNEIPETEMQCWISNREERFKFKPEWHH